MRERLTKLFVATAIAEAVSWLVLLVSMAVKYGPLENETGVHIAGPIHGGLFLAYGLLVLLVARAYQWSWPATAVALASAIPPFATVVFERWARRRGMLRERVESKQLPVAVGVDA